MYRQPNRGRGSAVKLCATLVAAFIFSNSASAAGLTENFDEPGGFFGGGTNNIPSFPPGDWQVINDSSPAGSNSWFNGPASFRTTFTAQSGTQYAAVDAASGSGTSTLSNWLLTPQITFSAGDQISFYTRTLSTPNYADRLQLYLSTNGSSTNVGSSSTDVGDFTNLLIDINPNYKVSGGGSFPNSWTQFTATVPTAGSGRFGFRYFVENGGPGGSNSDFIGLDTISVTTSSPNHWAQSTGGSWGTAGNWSGGIPGGSGVKIGFLTSPGLTAPGTITLDGNRTIGQITFDNANGYTISPGTGGTLTIDDSAAPSITVNNGLHTINAPISLTNGLAVTVSTNTGLTINAAITGTGALTTTSSGKLKIGSAGSIGTPLTINGTLEFLANPNPGILVRTIPSVSMAAASSVVIDNAAVSANRSVIVTGALSFAGSTGAWQGKIDLRNNDVIVHNGSLNNVTDQLKQGSNFGTWTGAAGIVSSTAAGDTLHTLGVANNLSRSFDGQTLVPTDVAIKYTYYGDADLDGAVTGNDYTLIDSGFSTVGAAGWQHGDFNYDGKIDGSDYSLIDNAFNRQTGTLSATSTSEIATATAVPEPAPSAILGLFSIVFASRRQREKAE